MFAHGHKARGFVDINLKIAPGFMPVGERMIMKICKECKNNFIITFEDKKFYQKINVPEPTLCFNCRQQRRYAFRNERTFYQRNCDLCKRKIISIYSPNKPFKVYCQDCWWSDRWDSLDYGQEFNFNKPFFEQFKELMLKVPRLALVSKNSENSEYANHSGDNKNVYLSSVIWYSENIYYSNWVSHSQDCIDCTYILDKAELCYELITSSNCYNCQYSNLLFNCYNCNFCYDLRGCNNCFMCSNLRNKKYCIKNKQYSQHEYEFIINKIDFGSFTETENIKNDFEKWQKNNTNYRNIIDNSENCTGNHIFHSINCLHCFDISKMENSKYCVSALETKDSYDIYHCGYDCDLLYESHALVGAHNCRFSHFSYNNTDLEYCDSCHNSHDLFGCSGMIKNNNCILNKQYSAKEYKRLKEQIIRHMLKTKEYGEFFPAHLSPFGYNETVGQFYMPLTKEKAIKNEFNWENNQEKIFQKSTVDLADNIKRINHDICDKILVCQNCAKNYKIILEELDFYKKNNIPIPRLCSNCRYIQRMLKRRPRKI